MQPTSDWLYLLIYPGSLDHLDMAVKAVVAPLVSQFHSTVRRWFFIRYLDEHGAHLRLRFQGNLESLQAIRQRADEWVLPCLNELSSQPADSGMRLIPTPSQSLLPGPVALRYGTYEPEHEKYGGPEGVAIAEELFQASSQLVVTLFGERIPPMSDRAVIALVLMTLVADNCVRKATAKSEFWNRYHRYWGDNAAYGGADLLRQLRVSAERRREVLQQQMSALTNQPKVQRLISDYAQAAQLALRRVTREHIRVSPADLCFHYIHMTNNRLGILPLEEAYLACFMLSDQAVAK